MPATVAITSFDLITGFGRGVPLCWEALLAGRTAIAEPRRHRRTAFAPAPVAEVPGLPLASEGTVAWTLCRALMDAPELRVAVAADADLFVATTVGEVELLERAVETRTDASGSRLPELCAKIEAALGVLPGQGTLVSAACASGSAAVALAAQRIRAGRSRCAVIMACDSVSEFVMAGFHALMALDPRGSARPFDRGREGLSLGEAAAAMVLMDADLARELARPVLAVVAGWGLSDDAHHITAPSRDGAGLAEAIREALRTAGVPASEIAFISGHGTGTVYNDAMEMKAYHSVFPGPVALYGLKGAVGHTLGAAGLIEAGLAAEALQRNVVPPTVGLRDPDPEAAGWVSPQARTHSGRWALCANAGFGGINTALCLERPER